MSISSLRYPICLLASVFSLAAGCATTEKKTTQNPRHIESLAARSLTGELSKAEPTHYLVTVGKTKVNPDPLPNYVPFWLLQYRGEILVKRYLQFKGWDYNKDGIIDHLTELSDKGEPKASYFDFNFDGVIDAVESQYSSR